MAKLRRKSKKHKKHSKQKGKSKGSGNNIHINITGSGPGGGMGGGSNTTVVPMPQVQVPQLSHPFHGEPSQTSLYKVRSKASSASYAGATQNNSVNSIPIAERVRAYDSLGADVPKEESNYKVHEERARNFGEAVTNLIRGNTELATGNILNIGTSIFEEQYGKIAGLYAGSLASAALLGYGYYKAKKRNPDVMYGSPFKDL